MDLSRARPLLGVWIAVVAASGAAGAHASFARAASLSNPAVRAEFASSDGDKAADEPLEEMIVTGSVANSRTPSVAVSTLKAADVQAAVPISAADLLKNVPGVFVNTALGETRNIVYSRGVSANSTDGNAGYFYVSLQEDGLPVTNITASNYGPDFFYRQDLSLNRVEALRGGTAVVTGPNAPGGIFNYIDNTGKTAPGSHLSVRLGWLGEDGNPYSRYDGYFGGRVRDDLYYSISGFYRRDRGARDPGYDFDNGGQVKANLLYDNDATQVLVSAKVLEDHNLFHEFLPARNYANPHIVPQFDAGSSLIMSPSPTSYIPFMGGDRRNFDAKNKDTANSEVLSLKIDHDFDNGWAVENNIKVNHNKVVYNTGAAQNIMPLLDPLLTGFLQTNRVGTYNFTNRSTGALLAQVVRTTAGNGASGATVTVNNLPNRSLLDAGVVSQRGYDTTFEADEVMDQLSATKRLENMSFKGGGFYARSKLDRLLGSVGQGVAPMLSQPDMMNITLTTPAGVVQQVTSPSGFASQGQAGAGTQTNNTQTQQSIFGGWNWEITDRLSTDIGLRYENIEMEGVNRAIVQNPLSSTPTYGGIDGNPNTLYDNYVVSLGAPIPYDFELDYGAYSGAVTYKFTPRDSVFVRASKGKKAPDLIFYATIDTPAKASTLYPIAQDVQQFEIGYGRTGPGYSISLNPFYSKLSNVGTVQSFIDTNGVTYANPPLTSTIEDIGIEIEGDLDIDDHWSVRAAITAQDPRSKDFAVYVANTPSPADDTLSRVPDGLADNNPKLMSTTTLRYRRDDRFDAFLTHKYLGERAANRYNAFFLPAFHLFDLGAAYNFTDYLSVAANISNLLDEAGVMSFSGSGSFQQSLDRQAITPAQVAADPNGLLNILTTQGRSYFLTVNLKFSP